MLELPWGARGSGEEECRGGTQRAVLAGKTPSVCPVNPRAKCLECHMPKVPMPTLHRELTDHYIRVHDSRKKK